MSTYKTTYYQQFTIIALLFAVFGFVTWLNGILIPFLKKACELSDQQAFYVTTAFFASYFLLALPSSWILNKVGTKKGMTIGLLTMAAGCVIFISAASSRTYSIFLTGLFIVGMGLALLQTAANPYVSIIGPIESAAKRISFMGLANKLAGILANALFGSILLRNASQIQSKINVATTKEKNELLNELASRVEVPYWILAAILIVIAFIIYRSSLPDIKEQAANTEDGETYLTKGKTSVFQFPHVILGAFAIFAYVGVEVMAGDLIIVYGQNLGFSEDNAKFFTIFGLVGLIIGYITTIIIVPKYISQERWLTTCTILGILLTITSYIATEEIAVGALAALGFANAVMWPAIFPLGIRDIGKFSNTGSALLIMGIVGGAIIPPFYGWLYEDGNILGFDFRSAFLVIMLMCYFYILWFSKKGYAIGFPKD